MAKQKQIIIEDIEKFKIDNEGEYPDYYIGITNNINRRMVEQSEVIQEHLQKGEYTDSSPLYTEECENREEAVEIERYFQDKGMLKYNPRSVGIKKSIYIYCYKLTAENKAVLLTEASVGGKKMRKVIDKFKDFKG